MYLLATTLSGCLVTMFSFWLKSIVQKRRH
ncbi:type I toxin-antitoxin system Fst family toxin [Staphylococcus caledonicus]|nr:type I toxin-antitoxin system Fst family toxin [Staphylococcus sp. acrmy]